MSRTGRMSSRTYRGGLGQTREYFVWRKMVCRCHDERDPRFAYYGARGIAVCERWRNDLAAFLADVGQRPSPKHSLDRIDNDRGYEPGNVRWATQREQMRNTRKNRLLTVRGETRSLAEWAERFGIRSGAILYRLSRGWSHEAAVCTPLAATGLRRRLIQEASR